MKDDDAIDRAMHMETYQMRRLEIQRLIFEASKERLMPETQGAKALVSAQCYAAAIERLRAGADEYGERVRRAIWTKPDPLGEQWATKWIQLHAAADWLAIQKPHNDGLEPSARSKGKNL